MRGPQDPEEETLTLTPPSGAVKSKVASRLAAQPPPPPPADQEDNHSNWDSDSERGTPPTASTGKKQQAGQSSGGGARQRGGGAAGGRKVVDEDNWDEEEEEEEERCSVPVVAKVQAHPSRRHDLVVSSAQSPKGRTPARLPGMRQAPVVTEEEEEPMKPVDKSWLNDDFDD